MYNPQTAVKCLQLPLIIYLAVARLKQNQNNKCGQHDETQLLVLIGDIPIVTNHLQELVRPCSAGLESHTV